MSKTAEQKALEEYPKSYVDENISFREGYAKGYDQAMQDFMEKAEKFLSEKVSDYFWWNQEECFVDFDKEDCLEQFKKYMQDES